MSDFVLINGDKAVFEGQFGPATVDVQDGKLIASATKGKVGGKEVCVEGDEASVIVAPCTYTSGQFAQTKGTGKLTISSLGVDQKAIKVSDAGKAVLLVGKKFIASFDVISPALAPPKGSAPPEPDPVVKYSGFGKFETKNEIFKVT